MAAPADWPRLAKLESEGIRLSALAVDLSTGERIAAHNAGHPLIPASLSKLYTAAAVLQHWGPDHRFITRLVGDAAPDEGGRLEGDLVLQGGADPGLGHEDLRTMVAELRAQGLVRVTGDLVIDESLLGAIPCKTKDRCDARRQSAHAFDGPLSAAGIDYGSVEIVVQPAAEVRRPAQVRLALRHLPAPRLDADVVTVSARAPLRLHITRYSPDDGPDVLRIRGQIPRGHEPVRRSRSVSDAAVHTGRVLRQLLLEGGILVEGELRIRSEAPQAPYGHLLVRHDGAPLAELIRRMQHYSNNYMADLMTLALARDIRGQPMDLPEAALQLFVLGPRRDTERFESGSGLSVDSRLSADGVVDLLRSVYEETAYFPAFLGSLPVPAYSLSRQLQGGDADWRHRVAAKTGWLSEPVGVRAVAGYARSRSGRWIAFAVILNASEEQPVLPRGATLDALRADLSELLRQHGDTCCVTLDESRPDGEIAGR